MSYDPIHVQFKDKQHESTVIKARKGLNAGPREGAEWEKTRSALQRGGDIGLLCGGYMMTQTECTQSRCPDDVHAVMDRGRNRSIDAQTGPASRACPEGPARGLNALWSHL